jgi:hypothetical protein
MKNKIKHCNMDRLFVILHTPHARDTKVLATYAGLQKYDA